MAVACGARLPEVGFIEWRGGLFSKFVGSIPIIEIFWVKIESYSCATCSSML